MNNVDEEEGSDGNARAVVPRTGSQQSQARCCLRTAGAARRVENKVKQPLDATPRHIDPSMSTIVNLIRRWFISKTPQDCTAIDWPFDEWDLQHVTGRKKDEDMSGIQLPLSFEGEREIPNLGRQVHFFGERNCDYSERVIHSIITLIALVRIAESLSSAKPPKVDDRLKTMEQLLEALVNFHDCEIQDSKIRRRVLYDPLAQKGTVRELANKVREFIERAGAQWSIYIDQVTDSENHTVDVVRATNGSEEGYNFLSYKGHLGIWLRDDGAPMEGHKVVEAMAAFALGQVLREKYKNASCATCQESCDTWRASFPSGVVWIISIIFSWFFGLWALYVGELQCRRDLYALMTHVEVQRELNKLIAAARKMQPWKWLFFISVETVVVNFTEVNFPGSVALLQSLVLLLLAEEVSWILQLREVHGTEAVALAVLELHTGYYLRAWFDTHCVNLRIPLAMGLVTAFVAFKIAPSQVAYETANGEFRVVPSDSKWAMPVIAVLTCGTAIMLFHAMNIAMSVAPRLLLSHIRALTGGTLSGSTGLAEAVLNYLDTNLKDTEEEFSKWATSVTAQAAVLSRLMWPSVVPRPDDDDAKEIEKSIRKRKLVSIMRDESPLAHRAIPIENQGMFTAMVNHEMDIAGIVVHELACSGSNFIMKPDIYASFLCHSFPKSYGTFKGRFFAGCRAKTTYKLDLKRNVYSVQIDNGRFIMTRDNIIVGAAPPVATPYPVELWNGALRRASAVTDSGSYFFDYHEKKRHALGKVGLSELSPSNCLVPMWAANGEPEQVIALDFAEKTITLSKVKYG